jgi:ABC-2 type transport system permease protein
MNLSSSVSTAAPGLNTPPSAMQLEPTLLRTIRGLWRLTWRRRLNLRSGILLGVGLLVLPLLIYFSIPPGAPNNPDPFWHWCLDFYFFLILPLYCLIQFGGMIRDDIHSETLVYLLTRPISRKRFFLVQFLCLLVWIEMVVLVQTGLIGLAGVFRGVPEVLSGMAWIMGFQVAAVIAWGAVSAFLGLLTKRYLVLGLLYGIIVEIGIGRIPTNINNLSLSRHFEGLLARHAPFADLFSWTIEPWTSSFLWIAAATIILLGLGSAFFTLREFHAGEQMKK